ncbi:MAG: CpsD/CapB family tyrosine-protein kinase [Eubacteriales bacterium]|nr:CpsD/CapB family tyrosine-protein kinase [Eubacteriales bacterium]
MANIVDTYYQAKSSLREAVKTLRTNISFSSVEHEIQTIVVTSPSARLGKTTTASFLGVAYAETGKKVLLVDTDCRRPMLANVFRQRPQYGMLQVLYGEVTIEQAAEESRQSGLYIMDCGGKITNPVEFINSKRFSAFVSEARKKFDVVIFDTPPLGTFIEAALLAAQADGTLIVIQPGKVQSGTAKDIVDQLKKANAHILGVVFNNVVNAKSDGYYYYYRKGGKSEKKRERIGRTASSHLGVGSKKKGS